MEGREFARVTPERASMNHMVQVRRELSKAMSRLIGEGKETRDWTFQ